MATKTSSKTTSTRNTTATSKSSSKLTAKPVAKTAPKQPKKKATKTPALSVVKEAQPAKVSNELKKRELLDLVIERSDVKKKYAKPVVEAMIEVLGEALADERSLNLQPMGRVVPKRMKDAGANLVMTARIRQSKARAEETAVRKASNEAVAKPDQ